jgi:hypothetical protein
MIKDFNFLFYLTTGLACRLQPFENFIKIVLQNL